MLFRLLEQPTVHTCIVIVQGTLTLTLSPHGAREHRELNLNLLPPGGGGSRWGGELLQFYCVRTIFHRRERRDAERKTIILSLRLRASAVNK